MEEIVKSQKQLKNIYGQLAFELYDDMGSH